MNWHDWLPARLQVLAERLTAAEQARLCTGVEQRVQRLNRQYQGIPCLRRLTAAECWGLLDQAGTVDTAVLKRHWHRVRTGETDPDRQVLAVWRAAGRVDGAKVERLVRRWSQVVVADQRLQVMLRLAGLGADRPMLASLYQCTPPEWRRIRAGGQPGRHRALTEDEDVRLYRAWERAGHPGTGRGDLGRLLALAGAARLPLAVVWALADEWTATRHRLRRAG
ncbi:MAG TPA: hypothetical protein PLN94_01705 [Thiolinea sp.]|nr:hypothetical protein [Thiolinea sp.]